MSNSKDKKEKKKNKSPKEQLTEWQQRNIEFLKRKRDREAEQRRQEQEAKEAAKIGLKTVEESETIVEEINEEPQKTPRIPKKEVFKALPILLIAITMLIASIVMITPYSKLKTITISGEQQTKASDIKKASQIKDSDYITQIWLNRQKYAQNIVDSNEWVKSAKIDYRFPNHFIIEIEEYAIIAYTDTEDGYRPILENGTRPRSEAVNQLPDNYITINLTDEKKIQHIIQQLTTVKKAIVADIETIDPIENAATKDLLLLGMTDGHQIRIPLSKIAQKLPYYSQVLPNLTEPSIVDMEVGIYTTTDYLESMLSQNRAENATKSDDTDDTDSNTSLEDTTE